MKRILFSLIASFALFQLVAAEAKAEGEWLTDFPKAQAKAKAEKKLILLDFTGSDWCGWCIKFKEEVLTKPEFLDYAKKNLVLVEVDFPRRKAQPEAEQKANQALQQKYAVKGYPTFVILDGDGKEVGRQRGYAQGGPKAFVAKIEGFKTKS